MILISIKGQRIRWRGAIHVAGPAGGKLLQVKGSLNNRKWRDLRWNRGE